MVIDKITDVDKLFINKGYKVIYNDNDNDVIYIADNPFNPSDLPLVTIWTDAKDVMVSDNDNKLAFMDFWLIDLIKLKLDELRK